MNLAQNVSFDDFRVKFETVSFGVKKLDHRAKSKESLVNTVEDTS